MSAAKPTSAKSTPLKERTGPCLAAGCSKPCSAPQDDRHVAGWQTCACGHTRAIHDQGDKK